MRRHIAGRRARVRHRRDLRLRADQRAGPALARAAAVADARRPVERGVPVPRRARDRHRLRARAVRPHHVPRRARLRAVHPGRAGGCTSTTGSSRPAREFGLRARRPEGAREPAHGEGLPRLRPRHRQHRLGARGRARLRGRSGEAGRVHRPGRGRGAEGRRPAATRRLVQVLLERPGAADVPRRGRAPRRRAGRLHPRRVVRPHARRRGRARDGGGARGRSTQAWLEAGDWEVEIAEKAYPATVSLRPLYDPTNLKIKA